MKVVVDIFNFHYLYAQSWGGALNVLDEIKMAGKQDELMIYLDSIFEETVDEVMLNDYIWFECDEIYEALGMKEVDEEW
jgi:hypothetical protein